MRRVSAGDSQPRAPRQLGGLARRLSVTADFDDEDMLTELFEGRTTWLSSSVDDLEGMEITVDVLADADALTRISDSLAALASGDLGVDLDTVRADLAHHRTTASGPRLPGSQPTTRRGPRWP